MSEAVNYMQVLDDSFNPANTEAGFNIVYTPPKRGTICLDFDGCIHYYREGWKGAADVYDIPVPGAKEAIEQFRKAGFKPIVFSARCGQEGGIDAIKEWLSKYEIDVDVAETKPPASVYVDDRAVCFKGDWSETVRDAVAFTQWQKHPQAVVSMSSFIGTFVKFAVSQSPYSFPEGLEVAVSKATKAFMSSDYRKSIGGFNYLELPVVGNIHEAVTDILINIPEVSAWNVPKKGEGPTLKFTSAYDLDIDPDYDFVDLHALCRNISMELARENES